MHRLRTTLAVTSLVIIGTSLVACSDEMPDNHQPASDTPSITIDASTAAAYVRFGDPATVATVANPASDAHWDLAIAPDLTFAVNGGASGPGGVRAYCLCANNGLSLGQIEALTEAERSAAFDAVTAAAIPGDASFAADTATDAITGWFDRNAQTQAITTNNTVWGIRLASTSGAYAKFHVTAIPSPNPADAGRVTLQWAVEPTATSSLDSDRQATVDLSDAATIYLNLTTGATSNSAPAAPQGGGDAEAPTWDLVLHGYTIGVDGGSSGAGNAAAVLLVPSSFYGSYDAITAIPFGPTGIPSNAFTTDGAGGVFLDHPAYRYDPDAHQVYPTGDVYLIKRGSDIYKVQVAGYYSTAGVFGHVTVRYARLGS